MSPEATVRPATSLDLPRVWELILELAEYEHLSHAVSGSSEELHAHLNKHFQCSVCEADGGIVGYTLSFPTYSTFKTRPGLWLEDIYVTPTHRGKGLGKLMLDALIDQCREQGYGRMEWSVLDWNDAAIGFYEKIGATLLPDWRICRIAF